MAVRSLNGSSDFIRVTAPAYYSGPWTWVGLINRNTSAAYEGLYSIQSVASNPHVVLEFNNSDEFEVRLPDGVGQSVNESDYAWENTTDWMLCAIKYDPAGAALSKYKFHATTNGSSWTDEFANSISSTETDVPTDWVTSGSPILEFGRWNSSFNYYNGLLGMQALNIGTALSDGAIHALAGGTTATYVTAGFDHLWPFNQASTATAVTDAIGSLNQTAISGTTVVTGSDPSSALFNFADVWPPVDNPAAPPLRIARSNLRLG